MEGQWTRLQVLKLLLQLHELPLFLSNLEPGLNVFITGSTCSKIVNAVNKCRAEAVLEGETELETVRVSCLLNQGLEGVNVFIEHPLPLIVLVPILQCESCSLGQIQGKEFDSAIISKDAQSAKLPTLSKCKTPAMHRLTHSPSSYMRVPK